MRCHGALQRLTLRGRGCSGVNADLGACESLILRGCSCHITHFWHSQGHAWCRRALRLSLESGACGCQSLALISPSGGACFEEISPRLSSAHQRSAAEQPGCMRGPSVTRGALCMGSHSQ